MAHHGSIRCSVVVAFLATLLTPLHGVSAQASTWHSFCSSSAGGTAYFTGEFDTGLNGKARVGTRPIEREFLEYLKGRFGPRNNPPLSANCARVPSADAATTTLDGLKTQAQSQGSKVVEVEWKYLPDTAQVSLSNDFSRQTEGHAVEYVGKADHGYCVTEGIAGAQYVSSAFAVEGTANLSLWLNGFDKFLRAKYAYTGNGADPRVVNPVACNIGWIGEAERMIKARGDGARAGGRKVVDTGWKPNGAPAAAGPTKDDDPEPAPAPPPPPPPPADVRRFATDEGPAALALCENDRLISGPFDCNLVARTIYTYRIEHASAPPEPLQALFMGEKLDCKSCLKTNFLSMWAANRAMSNGFSQPKSECVGKKFEASITAHPYPHRVKDLFEAAMKACPK